MADICNLCGKDASLMCQRCNETYCSTNCQILDWRVHKKVCFQMPILVPIKENCKEVGTAVENRFINYETSRNRSLSEVNKNTKRPRNPIKNTPDEQLVCPQVGGRSVETSTPAELDFSLKPKLVAKSSEIPIKSNASQCSKVSTRNLAWRTHYRYPEGTFFDVIVQYVEEGNRSGIVWVTELKYETPLRKLLAEINRNIDINTSRCAREEIQIGALIAAPFENLYYRAEIIEIIQVSKMVVVHLIDYGNLVEVPFKDLRSAIPIMRNLNAYAFRIRYSKPVALESILSIRVLSIDRSGIAEVEEKIQPKPKPMPEGISAELFATSPTATLVKTSENGKYSLLCLNNDHVMKQLQEMNNLLNSDAALKLRLEKPPEDGDYVVARTFNGWSRAVVMNTYRNDYLVYLFDVGRIALVEQVLLVPENFTSIPMQVFAVELIKVLTEGKNLMDCLFHDKICTLKANKTARTQHNDRFPCFIVASDGKKIAEVEAFSYFGKSDEVGLRDWVEPLVSGSAVYITGVVGHSEVFISLLCTKLYPKIFSAAANDCDLLSSGKYEKGDLVLAQDENEYFRARILDVENSDTMKVLNVDTGVLVNVACKTIRKPNMFVLSCPYHTRKVKLMYLSNVETPYADNRARLMLEQCKEKAAEFILKFETNPELGVELLLKTADQQSLNKQLLPMLFEKVNDQKEKLNTEGAEKPSCMITRSPSPPILKNKIYTLKDLEIIPITCGNNVPIMVLDSSTISKSYISGCDFTDKQFLKKLESEYLPMLANHCAKFNGHSEYCPSVDEVCLAVYEGDKDWYRAVCLNQMKDDTFYVMYLDYGNMGRVHKSNIRRITEELMFPTNANMCIIEGLAEEVPQHLCEKFISTIQADPKIYAKVTKLEEDSYLIKIKNMEKYF